MDLLNYIFRLGVVFAIFNFIWFLLEMGYHLLRGSAKRTVTEVYTIKMIKYFFLVEVVFLFCLDPGFYTYDLRQLILCALILTMYLIGKMQKQQTRQVIFQMQVNRQPRMLQHVFNFRAEVAMIVVALSFFALLSFFPQLARNPVSIWFHDSIHSIQNTPVFGFIFNIVGFFFLLSIIFKLVNGLAYLITGNPVFRTQSGFSRTRGQQDQGEESSEGDDDDFDDYEEVK